MDKLQRQNQLLRDIDQLLAQEEMFRRQSNSRCAAIRRKMVLLKAVLERSDSSSGADTGPPAEAADQKCDRPPEKETSRQWITVSDAADLAGFHRGTITRKANAGEIIDNGRRGRDRRLKKTSVFHWKAKWTEQQRWKAFREYNRKLNHIPNKH